MPQSKASDTTDTKQRLLDAAESLIAAHGIAGASLRQITDEAGVNVALVKYHFGSKDALIEETLNRRLKPINEKRLALLTELEAATPKGALNLEAVLYALISPAVEMGLSGAEGRRFLKVFGRIFSEPADSIRIVHKQMAPMMKRFDAAFDRAVPGLDHPRMAVKKMACLGAVHHTLLMLTMMDELPAVIRIPAKLIKGAPQAKDVVDQLVAFCAAGIRAPHAD
jgi:AcrR family transcriptional regulator